jgi:hypothetical protein
MLTPFTTFDPHSWQAIPDTSPVFASQVFAAPTVKIKPYWSSLPPPPTVTPCQTIGFFAIVGLLKLRRRVQGWLALTENEMLCIQPKLL